MHIPNDLNYRNGDNKMKKWFAAVLVIAVTFSASAANDAFLKKKTLELLDAYCPDGSKIVRMCMPLYPKIAENEFMTMIDGSDERACLNSLNTVVHEENHLANTFIGREVLKEKFGKFSDVFYDYDYYYLKNDRFSLMHKTPTFPSIEMVPSFPERLRTFRFDTYINTQNTLQSTQNEGIYGLLDEMNSYYQGTKAAYDLLGYYEKKGEDAKWHDYFGGVNSSHYGCLEFRLYILKYLMFAEKKHPDIYKGILNNKTWCGTFLEVDRNVSDMLQSYFEVKPAIFERLRGYGWSVSEDINTLTIEANGRTSSHINFMGVIELLTEEMKKPEYLAMLRIIEELAKGWDPETVYSEVALAMKETKLTDTQGGIVDPNVPRLENRRRMEDVADLSDPEGDVEHPFVDLVGASASKDGDGLVVRMRLAGFPDRLTFCQPGVPENRMEYKWAVMFDLEGDGTDDFSIELTNFKPPESEPVTGDPLKEAQLTVWELNDLGGEASTVLFRGGKIGNELIFDVPMCGLVSSIGPETQVRFETYYTDGRTEDVDQMPE
jgi:hypothetical protein